MLNEKEIASIAVIPEVKELVKDMRKDFCKKEAPMLKITQHDFLSLLLIAPSIGIALANGTVSLFEELSLNKKARRYSKGGYFMQKDPVIVAMQYLIKSFDNWEDEMYEAIRKIMLLTFDWEATTRIGKARKELDMTALEHEILAAPYVLVQLLGSFFLPDDVDMEETRRISKVEYEKVEEIGQKLGLDQIPFFLHFCKTFIVK